MSRRKHKLVDLNPHFVRYSGRDTGPIDGIHFDCPEGHEGCTTTIPFTPALDGAAMPVQQRNGAQWTRTGENFENLTLAPSIRTITKYSTREEALKAGVMAEHYEERMICKMHIFIKNGVIEFCGDSK